MTPFTASIWLTTAVAIAQPSASRVWQIRSDRSAQLVQTAANRDLDSSARNSALSLLAATEFDKALEIAPSLLGEGDQILRARAAWILADGGRQAGLDVLRALARERTGESVIAMEMLGRLRDPESHELLVSLLEQELASPKKQGSFPAVPGSDSIISALSCALADYCDKRDAGLLARTIPEKVGAGHWVMVEGLGRGGGSEAIPVLERVFDNSLGWTAMAAGLGLARCGSVKGLSYVRGRLRDFSGDPSKPTESRLTNADTDSPTGPKGTDFVLTHLGAPADEILVPELLDLVTSKESSWVLKAQAWRALSRVNPTRDRPRLVELAWKNLMDSSAVKLIVLDDEAHARTVVPQLESSADRKEKAAAHELRRALTTTPRERRRWRETHGYSF